MKFPGPTRHSRRMRSTCFSGVCPVLPESDSYRPKSLASLRANRDVGQFHSITSSARPMSGSGESNAKRLGGLEIDEHLNLHDLLHRQIGGPDAVFIFPA